MYKFLQTFTIGATIVASFGVAFLYATNVTAEPQPPESFCVEMTPILNEAKADGLLSQDDVDYLLKNCYNNDANS